ncbi:MAG: glycosyltransferase family 39 protein [bacterium]
MTFQLGPDEDYYYRFALDVLHGNSGLTPEFVFMDPLYGYFLAMMFSLFGEQLFAVFLVQVMADILIAWLVYKITCRIWNKNAALISTTIYGLTSTALLYSCSLGKATFTALFVTLWVYFSLLLNQKTKLISWLTYGIFLGLGIALRANLILLSFASILIIFLGGAQLNSLNLKLKNTGLILLGLSIPLIILALRFYSVTGNYSIVPNNGGIVLHQAYNEDNPRSIHDAPSFVHALRPSDIWFSYEREAKLRLDTKELNPVQINAYWKSEAIKYWLQHPLQSLHNSLRKLFEFTSYKEIANNRSIAQEELFSKALKLLPRPFGFLFVFGSIGFALLLAKNKISSTWIAAPILSGIFVISVFFMISRFRFHITPILTVLSGLAIYKIYCFIKHKEIKPLVKISLAATLLTFISFLSGNNTNEAGINWHQVATGWIRSGEEDKAKVVIQEGLKLNPQDMRFHDLNAFLAIKNKNWQQAVQIYSQFLPKHSTNIISLYNYAYALDQIGRPNQAVEILERSDSSLRDSAYRLLLANLYLKTNNLQLATQQYQSIINDPNISINDTIAIKAQQSLKAIQKLKNNTNE